MKPRSLDALRREILAEHFPDLKSAPVIRACKNRLFSDRSKEMDWRVWRERPVSKDPWIALCGTVHWVAKPEHMYLPAEKRNTFFKNEEA